MESDAIAIAAGIESGTLQPESVCDYYLSRIKRLDCVLNAFVEVYARRARSQSRKIQATASPLAFVPIAIKDAHAIRGSRMRFGSAATQHLFSPIDDVLIRRLRRAGLVFLGKTAMSEFGVLPTCEPEIRVPTRNPFRLDLSPGGSSGGSAAAVAAGLAPIALGSDGGGSIRIPAAFCGLVGFKPSRGVVTNPFGRDSRELMWTCGPLTKSVRDAAALLDVLVSPGARVFSQGFAAWSRLRAGRRLSEEAPNFSTSLSRDVPRLRIRFTTESPLTPTNPSTAAAVQRVASLLEKAGHQVDAGRPLKGSTSVEEFLPLWQANTAQAPVRRWDQTETLTRWLGEAGRCLEKAQVSALAERIKERILAWFGDADIWLTPTVAPDPPRIGALRGLKPREAFEAAAQYGAFTAVFNVTGQPAVSLPAGVSPAGLPIGIQLIARFDEDMLLMALAAQVESMLAFRAPPTALPESRTSAHNKNETPTEKVG